MAITPATPLTLYHYWRSSCSWRVRWALALKGVAYASKPVNILAGEQRSPDYLARNPAGLLPTLAIGNRHVAESLAIMEWLDETWPEPALWPKDPLERLHARQLALTIVSGTQPLQNPTLLKYFSDDETKRQDAGRHWILRGLTTYETLLKQSPKGQFSCGDRITVADICLIPQVYNAKRFEVPLADLPRVTAIYDRARATAECKIAEPEQHQPS